MWARFVVFILLVFACSAPRATADPSAGAATPATSAAPSSSATTSPSPAATPAPLAIAFDEVERQLGGTATPPPPNAFSDEVQAALDAQKQNGGPGPSSPNMGQMAIDMIPVVGTIFSMSQAKKQQEAAKKQQQQMMDQLAGNKPPVLTRYAFYNGWSRVETANSIIITKPDQQLMIFIDPRAKTYHDYDTSAPVQAVAAGATAQPAAPSGEGSATSIDSTNQADALTIDGQPVTGFSEEALVTLSGSNGACHDGTFRAKKLEYFSQMAEPMSQAKAVQPIDTLALPEGCTATIARQQSGGPTPDGQMWLYQLVTVVRDPNVATQTGSSGSLDPAQMMGMANPAAQASGLPANYMLLSERGNIRQLTAADSSMFDVPAGYAEDK